MTIGNLKAFSVFPVRYKSYVSSVALWGEFNVCYRSITDS
jgi:hypothetical protein